jgi:hypothetical protein
MPNQKQFSKEETDAWERAATRDERDRARDVVKAAEAGEVKLSTRGTLAAKRKNEMARKARTTLLELVSHPALKMGQDLTEADRQKLVDEYIAAEKFPAAVAETMRKVGKSILNMVAAGSKKEAVDLARESAMTLGDALARSAYVEPEDDFDVDAVVRSVKRF